MYYGMDISSKKVAIAGYDGDGYFVHEIKAPTKYDWIARFHYLYDALSDYVAENITEEDIVYVEDIPYVRNIKTLIILIHFVSMCRRIFYVAGITHYFISTNSYKSKTGVETYRKSREEVKKLSKERCKEIFGVDDSYNQDMIDALLIAYACYVDNHEDLH